MSRFLIMNISNILQRLESALPNIFGMGGEPPVSLAIAGAASRQQKAFVPEKQPTDDSLKDIMGDGILWAVPKHRRTIEKRLNRKFGWPELNWKPLKAKANLRSCNQCGHDHEVGVLCPHCYGKIQQETLQMQETIQAQLGLAPVEQEVVVLYEGEKSEQPELLEGKRIVEMNKPRPLWFTKNLMQRSTQQPANTTEVKPSNLG